MPYRKEGASNSYGVGRSLGGWIVGHREASRVFVAVSAGGTPGAWLSGSGISMDRAGSTARVIWT